MISARNEVQCSWRAGRAEGCSNTRLPTGKDVGMLKASPPPPHSSPHGTRATDPGSVTAENLNLNVPRTANVYNLSHGALLPLWQKTTADRCSSLPVVVVLHSIYYLLYYLINDFTVSNSFFCCESSLSRNVRTLVIT